MADPIVQFQCESTRPSEKYKDTSSFLPSVCYNLCHSDVSTLPSRPTQVVASSDVIYYPPLPSVYQYTTDPRFHDDAARYQNSHRHIPEPFWLDQPITFNSEVQLPLRNTGSFMPILTATDDFCTREYPHSNIPTQIVFGSSSSFTNFQSQTINPSTNDTPRTSLLAAHGYTTTEPIYGPVSESSLTRPSYRSFESSTNYITGISDFVTASGSDMYEDLLTIPVKSSRTYTLVASHIMESGNSSTRSSTISSPLGDLPLITSVNEAPKYPQSLPESLKPTIERLWLEENKTLVEVKQILKNKHRVFTSESTLKRRLKGWGLTKYRTRPRIL